MKLSNRADFSEKFRCCLSGRLTALNEIAQPVTDKSRAKKYGGLEQVVLI